MLIAYCKLRCALHIQCRLVRCPNLYVMVKKKPLWGAISELTMSIEDYRNKIYYWHQWRECLSICSRSYQKDKDLQNRESLHLKTLSPSLENSTLLVSSLPTMDSIMIEDVTTNIKIKPNDNWVYKLCSWTWLYIWKKASSKELFGQYRT